MTKTQKLWTIAGGVVATVLAACLGIVTAVGMDAAEQPPPVSAVSSTSGPDSGWGADAVSPTPAPASKSASPATATIEEGTWTVGTDIPAGTYRSSGVTGMCYWAITKTGSNGSDIINNDLPTGGRPQVTLKKGQDFETSGECGVWHKIR